MVALSSKLVSNALLILAPIAVKINIPPTKNITLEKRRLSKISIFLIHLYNYEQSYQNALGQYLHIHF